MKFPLLTTILCCLVASAPLSSQTKTISFKERTPLNAPEYVCYKTNTPIIIDGILSDEEWEAIPPIGDFVDIIADKSRAPHLNTMVKMAHDDKGLYIGAWLEEPHLWATLTRHDATVFLDNAFEVFFNPSNDTHNYLEYEVNALGTIWDLMLNKAYRDQGMGFSGWEFAGMKTAVHLDGTLNDPRDTDKGWSVEIFFPWESIYQVVTGKNKPADGDQIRVNFMRVQWPIITVDGKYVKRPLKEGEQYIESYWLWAPLGEPSTHLPEYWGYVQFTDQVADESVVPFVKNKDEEIKWILRNLYYRQGEYKKAFTQYASDINDLKPEEICPPDLIGRITLHTTPSMYEISLSGREEPQSKWGIRQDGLIWRY